MYIRELNLTHFRNYQGLNLSLSPGINCITGPNGAGKTNILDALHYLALTRGFRSSQDKHALQEGEDFFFISGEVEESSISQNVQCNFVKGKGKKVLINNRPLKKMSEHIGKFPLVAVLPNDTELINGPSADRRRFLDVLISQYSSKYLFHLIQYEKILAQRNALLKSFAEQRGFDSEQLELWSAQLVPHGVAIQKERIDFLKEYQPVFLEYFKKIVSKNETPQIQYRSQVKENSLDGWMALYKETEQKDRYNQYTGAGTHRDDLVFKINDQSVRNFGSQGQQKTFIIALKLAQYRLLQDHKTVAPILLLDDIFDKLDEHRLTSIGHILDREIDGQIFITDTSYQRLSKIFAHLIASEANFFEVLEGKVEKR